MLQTPHTPISYLSRERVPPKHAPAMVGMCEPKRVFDQSAGRPRLRMQQYLLELSGAENVSLFS